MAQEETAREVHHQALAPELAQKNSHRPSTSGHPSPSPLNEDPLPAMAPFAPSLSPSPSSARQAPISSCSSAAVTTPSGFARSATVPGAPPIGGVSAASSSANRVPRQ